jgi:uncharacterized protein involved in type VI secretion and phage assembly
VLDDDDMEEGAGVQRFPGFYFGTVAANEDPEKRSRVRLTVPGILDKPSAWAIPLGASVGKQDGEYDAPDVGATVAVTFMQGGDPEQPAYFKGHWAKGETPTYVGALSAADATKVREIETKEFELIFDDRSGNEKIIIKSKTSGVQLRISKDKIEVGNTGQLESAVFGGTLKAKLEALCDAFIAHTHPTGVGPSGPPANAATVTTLKGQLSQILTEGL